MLFNARWARLPSARPKCPGSEVRIRCRTPKRHCLAICLFASRQDKRPRLCQPLHPVLQLFAFYIAPPKPGGSYRSPHPIATVWVPCLWPWKQGRTNRTSQSCRAVHVLRTPAVGRLMIHCSNAAGPGLPPPACVKSLGLHVVATAANRPRQGYRRDGRHATSDVES